MKYRSRKTGFTIIEVALFVALSGFLMVGIIVGANTSISHQRYNDSVNSFADLIRGTYSDVLNISSDKNPELSTDEAGRTKTAVYGKLISIGECINASVNCNNTNPNNVDDTIYIYDIVGLAVNSSSVKGSRAIDMLSNSIADGGVDANIIDRSQCSGASTTCEKFYRMTTYKIPWEGRVEKKNDNENNKDNIRFRAAIFIVRSPSTGNIRTYTHLYGSEERGFHFRLNTGFANGDNARDGFSNYMRKVGSGGVGGNNNGENELIMCIDSDDNRGNRRGLKVYARATNSAGISLTEADLDDSCK